LRGSYFALKRIGRCHPWVEPMVDPVPPPPSDGSTPVTKVKG
jgi:putative component of membrane protein insertase Oxa1/YidC/SpoIIIJ protein YidD